jgi:hypothetical protein
MAPAPTEESVTNTPGHLSARVPDKVLRPVLATILVIVGVRMLRA